MATTAEPSTETAAPDRTGRGGTVRERVQDLLPRMADEPQFPTQGCVLFVDLAEQETTRAYMPRDVVESFLGGRGGNMWLLYNLADLDADPLDPERVPLIFGTGLLTGCVPSAARGNVTSISCDSRALMDSNCGDYFPSYMKLHGYDHIVLFGEPAGWSLLHIEDDEVAFEDADPYLGLNNIDLVDRIEEDYDCEEGRDMAMARITEAGENLVRCAGIMGGPKAIWARGGTGTKMGSLKVKALLITGVRGFPEPADEDFREYNKHIAKKTMQTSVVTKALSKTGTPFLYRPSRVLGAMGTKNNQLTTWTDKLDADNIDPYRSGMSGCFKCPVNCRPLNDMTEDGEGWHGAKAQVGAEGNASYDKSQVELEHDADRDWEGKDGDGEFDRYDKGDGPEYVTLGKFGPNIGIEEVEHVLRLNNVCNDLGLDTASTGSSIAWAMELSQRGIIDQDLEWGDADRVEELLFETARREGFGDAIADSARAVEQGHYPKEALDYRMAIKGLFQSDPHDARILKAFGLGLAVATRGSDHLRNRVTLEINASINDDPEYKNSLYDGEVSGEPDAYDGKEIAVRKCEDIYAAGDAVGMCRFTTALFNSPNLPGPEDFSESLKRITGLELSEEDVEECGRNITGLERMINWHLGLRGSDDTLPDRWFDEGTTYGPFEGERVDREKFRELKQRFYEYTGLNREGLPEVDWHEELSRLTRGFAVRVKVPRDTPGAPEGEVVLDDPSIETAADVRVALREKLPEAEEFLSDETLNLAVNGDMIMSGEADVDVGDGDEVEVIRAVTGG